MLSEGIAAFEAGNQLFKVPDVTLQRLWEHKDSLIRFFAEHEELLATPYTFRQTYPNGSILRLTFPAWAYHDNPIFKELERLTLHDLEPGSDISAEFDKQYAFKAFDHQSRDEVEEYWLGYRRIDTVLWFIHLLNIYVPQSRLIDNVVSSAAVTNAFGRTSLLPALKPLSKIVTRTTGEHQCNPEEVARQLLVMWQCQQTNREREQHTKRNGIQFERLCADSLSSAGFLVRATQATGDFGADLIVEHEGLLFAIQCKDTAKPVGVKAVQEAAGARAHYSTDFAVVCSTGGYTEAAISLAASNGVLLCNHNNLAGTLHRAL